jgi:hypothetical protein
MNFYLSFWFWHTHKIFIIHMKAHNCLQFDRKDTPHEYHFKNIIPNVSDLELLPIIIPHIVICYDSFNTLLCISCIFATFFFFFFFF